MYAIVLGDLAPGSLRLSDVPEASPDAVELLGYGPVPWSREGADLIVTLPECASTGPAFTLALSRRSP